MERNKKGQEQSKLRQKLANTNCSQAEDKWKWKLKMKINKGNQLSRNNITKQGQKNG